MKQNRLKSKVVWLAVLSQLLLVVILYKPEIAEPLKITATSIIEILTLFGVLNDPSSKDNF